MGKVLARTVHITGDDNQVVTLLAGSEVPKEYAEFVTNPRAFADVDAAAPAEREAEGSGSESDAGAPDYDALKVPDLKDLLKQRELPQEGTKPELIERLREDDAEREAEGSGSESESEE